MASWEIGDPSDLRETAKYTFSFPSTFEIEALKAGNLVKLRFDRKNPEPDSPGAERMWVEVVSKDATGGFHGKLASSPAFIEDLEMGADLTFEAKHIIGTDVEVDDIEVDIVERYFPRCFVTKRILYDGIKAGNLYREEPEQPHDSGWRLLAGDETEEYMTDSENLFYVSLGAVLNRDDRFVHLLDSPVGSEFEFDEKLGDFRLVTQSH